MKSSTSTFCRILVLSLFFCSAGTVYQAAAQAPGSGGPTPQDPTNVPLDGGASLLLASGVAYGLRQLRQRRKK